MPSMTRRKHRQRTIRTLNAAEKTRDTLVLAVDSTSVAGEEDPGAALDEVSLPATVPAQVTDSAASRAGARRPR